MKANIDFASVADAIGNRPGISDIPCPFCSNCRKLKNRSKKTFRVWFNEPEFLSFRCMHCGEQGYLRDGDAAPIDRAAVIAAQSRATARDAAEAVRQQRQAQALYSLGKPPQGTPAETYLRVFRNCDAPRLPATFRYLPPRGDYLPALMAPFGFADEDEPGSLSIRTATIAAVHLTRLQRDGMGKAGDPAKIMLGRPKGHPIVVAPMNDGLSLVITEGIEDALTQHIARGVGAWAAGSAGQMPALASAVPDYTEFVWIVADDNPAGLTNAELLAKRLAQRGIETVMATPELRRAA